MRENNESKLAIIPPILVKDELNSTQGEIYKHVWDEVGKAFKKANKIIFIGYSMPRGDTLAYQTILKSVKQSACKVEIINPDGDRLKQELSRIFGENSVTWDYTNIAAYSRSFR